MSIKGRNWAFVVYPESLPANWEEIITETGLPMAFSPHWAIVVVNRPKSQPP